MSFLSDSISLINSTYSKEKIIDLFRHRLEILGVKRFILTSPIVQYATVTTLDKPEIYTFVVGAYTVCFQYEVDSNNVDFDSLEIMIAALVTAIENSFIYGDLTRKLSVSGGKTYPTYTTLITDIEKEVESYKRYGTEFCVAKICLKKQILTDKHNFKMDDVLTKVKDLVRASDGVYRDERDVYIIFKNVSIDTGFGLRDKLKSSFPNCDVGIADWKSSYVMVDLFGEIDNSIYMISSLSNQGVLHQKNELNKILNKAIPNLDTVVIVRKEDILAKHEPYVALNLTLNDKQYSVLRRFEEVGDFEKYYMFNHEDIADDVFERMSKIFNGY